MSSASRCEYCRPLANQAGHACFHLLQSHDLTREYAAVDFEPNEEHSGSRISAGRSIPANAVGACTLNPILQVSKKSPTYVEHL